MNKKTLRLRLNSGQGLMELVVGLGLISIVIGAIAIMTASSLQSSQFAKSQTQATKIAQENLEKVRTIRNTNFGVCTQAQGAGNCSPWDAVWGHPFFGTTSTSCAANVGCTFVLQACTVAYPAPAPAAAQPFCLKYTPPATRGTLADGFTYQILVEDEAANQKKVTSRVFWTNNTGEHSSDLVTIFSRL